MTGRPDETSETGLTGRQKGLLAAAVAVGALTFAADLMTPRGFVGGVLGYFISILLAGWIPLRWTAFGFAAAASLLSLAGYALTSGGWPVVVLVNRLLLIAAYWAMAYLVDRRRAAEAALLRANREIAAQARLEQRDTALQLRTVADAVPALVSLLDPRLHYRFANARYREMFGIEPDGLIGRSVEEVTGPETFAKIRPRLERALAGEAVSYEVEMATPGGPRQLAVSYVPVREGGGEVTGIVVLVQDVTDQRGQERQLAHLQRMETIGQLTGGVAHDFNNLLNVIVGNLELIRSEVGDSPRAAELTREALKASLRGGQLTRQLLAFARRQPLHARAIGLNERIAETLDLLSRTLGERIEVETALAPDLWPAMADPAQLDALLANLALNARDAMPEGGRLTIRTANHSLDATAGREGLDLEPGDYVTVEVSDNGAGMAPEVAARAIEPFFTTKEPGRGTGLGLSMAYGFARQSKGHMTIRSTPGEGTTVCLYLPRADAAATSARESQPVVVSPPAAAAGPGGGRGASILVVEDDPDVRQVVARQITELGYRVVEAEDSEAALRIIDGGEPIDLLFTDVMMPGGMTGDRLALEARRRRPDLKVVLTSGYATLATAEGGGEPDVATLLSKPYRKAELAERLHAALSVPIETA